MEDDLFDAVRTADRRIVLRALRDDEPIAFETLATVVASDPGERTEAAIRLRHAHLPKLEAIEAIVWDRADGTVARGPRFEDVERVLAALESDANEPPLR